MFLLTVVSRIYMSRQSTRKSKKEQPLLVVILNGLKVGLKGWEELQEGFVFIHCISLSSGVKKELKEKKIGLDLHRHMEDLRLRRHKDRASTRECDEKGPK